MLAYQVHHVMAKGLKSSQLEFNGNVVHLSRIENPEFCCFYYLSQGDNVSVGIRVFNCLFVCLQLFTKFIVQILIKFTGKVRYDTGID